LIVRWIFRNMRLLMRGPLMEGKARRTQHFAAYGAILSMCITDVSAAIAASFRSFLATDVSGGIFNVRDFEDFTVHQGGVHCSRYCIGF
jgi:hypothetical protein